MTFDLTRRSALQVAAGGLLGMTTMAALAQGGGTGGAEAPVPADMAERIDLGRRAGLLSDLHGILALRDGKVILERYFTGEDNAWGQPLGQVAFDRTTLHDLRSVTKSMVSLLYGIALDQGVVPEPDAPLLEAFPEYPDLAADPSRAAWRISHALNMTLGTEWDEDLPYSDPRNSEIAMEMAEDRYRFVLDRPIVAEPGARWIYNGGCTALIGALIERGSGLRLDAFAARHLFAPLGIGDSEWSGGSDGVLSAASGLRLTAPGLARIGEMILAGGQWDGRTVVPKGWLDRCAERQAATTYGLGYSHFWYLSDQPVAGGADGSRFTLSAMGNGGQRLYVIPAMKLVVVLFAGAYNRPDQWMTPTMVLQRIILS